MERIAILIESSNVKDLPDLPGARKDIQNWNSFLQLLMPHFHLYVREIYLNVQLSYQISSC